MTICGSDTNGTPCTLEDGNDRPDHLRTRWTTTRGIEACIWPCASTRSYTGSRGSTLGDPAHHPSPGVRRGGGRPLFELLLHVPALGPAEALLDRPVQRPRHPSDPAAPSAVPLLRPVSLEPLHRSTSDPRYGRARPISPDGRTGGTAADGPAARLDNHPLRVTLRPIRAAWPPPVVSPH